MATLPVDPALARAAGEQNDLVSRKLQMDALRQRIGGGEDKEQKLRQACEGFESVFMQKMWEQMRNTVPKEGYLHSREEGFWQSMFDQELAKKMSSAGGIGLADMLYDQLSRTLVDTSKRSTGGASEPAPVPIAPVAVMPAPQESPAESGAAASAFYTPLGAQPQGGTPEAAEHANGVLPASGAELVDPRSQAIIQRELAAYARQVSAHAATPAQNAAQVSAHAATPAQVAAQGAAHTATPTQAAAQVAPQDAAQNAAQQATRAASPHETVNVMTPPREVNNPRFGREGMPVVHRKNAGQRLDAPTQAAQGGRIPAGRPLNTRFSPAASPAVGSGMSPAATPATPEMAQGVTAAPAAAGTGPATASTAGGMASPAAAGVAAAPATPGMTAAPATSPRRGASRARTPVPAQVVMPGAVQDAVPAAVQGASPLSTPAAAPVATGAPVGGPAPAPLPGAMTWPAEGRVAQGYGWRNDPVTGQRSWHPGVDLAAPAGSPVRASWDGKVVFAGEQGDYGKLVVVEHAGGWRTYYGHNAGLSVKEGDTVTAGSELASVGGTGRASGPHVHFEVRLGELALNPETLAGKAMSPTGGR